MKRIFLLLLLIIFSTIVFASSHEPKSISQIRDYSLNQVASISILIALIGGIISILSPCAWPLIPAFFAFTLGDKKRIVHAASLFYLGLLIPIIALNFGAVLVGNILIENKDKFILLAGLILIILGLITFFNKGLGFNIKNKIFGNNWTLILFGAAFSLGFTPCVFPITSAIAFISAGLSSYLFAGLLSIAYVTGQASIIFLGAVFFDKFKILNKKIFQKEIKIFGKQFLLVKIISGLILIFLGIMFLIYGGSILFNLADPFGTMTLVTYAQELFLSFKINSILGNILGILILILIGYLIYKNLK